MSTSIDILRVNIFITCWAEHILNLKPWQNFSPWQHLNNLVKWNNGDKMVKSFEPKKCTIGITHHDELDANIPL